MSLSRIDSQAGPGGREARAHGSKPLVIERETDFLVSTRAYSDPEIFERELEEVFYKNWIYLGHETEIPKPGDHKSTRIGKRPVVLARELDGSVHAFLNFCPHRGAALCRQEYGHSKLLVCPYHSWSFRLSGEAVSVTDPERYPNGFKATKGLTKVARVEVFGGLIFGNFDPDAPTLTEYFGGAGEQIDLWLARAAGGHYRVTRPHKYLFRGNWKLQIENIYDGYHPTFVHGSALNAFRALEIADRSYQGSGGVRQVGRAQGFPGGHGSLENGVPLESNLFSKEMKQNYADKIAAAHGTAKVETVLENRHVVIFPSVGLMGANIRVVQPIAHDLTEVYSFPVLIEGMSDEFNFVRLMDLQLRLGTAGMIGADDIEVFNSIQTAVQSGAEYVSLARGLTSDESQNSDDVVGGFSDEAPQRAFWRQWQRLMGG